MTPCPSWLVWWYGAVDRDALLLTETGEVWWYDIPPPHAYPMRERSPVYRVTAAVRLDPCDVRV